MINIKPGANTSGTSGLFALLKSYFAKFGVPVVLSDDGTEFIANRAKRFLAAIENQTPTVLNIQFPF